MLCEDCSLRLYGLFLFISAVCLVERHGYLACSDGLEVFFVIDGEQYA